MAITSVEQANTSFYTKEGVDPSTSNETFLSYNPDTNDFEYISYQEMLDRAEPSYSPDLPQTQSTISDLFSQASGGYEAGPYSPVQNVEGSIQRAAHGMGTFGTIRDIIGSARGASLPGLAMSAYSGVTAFKEGMARVETFEKAAQPTATVGELLDAYSMKPSAWDVAQDIGMTALSGFIGDVIGVGTGVLNTASTLASRQEADEAFGRAFEMQKAERERIDAAPVESFEYVNARNAFNEQQQANLAAASTGGSSATTTTIRDVMMGADYSTSFTKGLQGSTNEVTAYRDSSTGDVYSRTSFSGGGSVTQNISENQRTAARREEEGYQPSTMADRRGTTSRDRTGMGYGGDGGFGGGGGSVGRGSSLGGESGGTVGGDSGWGR